MSGSTGIPKKEQCQGCSVRWQQTHGYCWRCWRVEERRRRVSNGVPVKAHSLRSQVYFPPVGMIARSLIAHVIAPLEVS